MSARVLAISSSARSARARTIVSQASALMVSSCFSTSSRVMGLPACSARMSSMLLPSTTSPSSGMWGRILAVCREYCFRRCFRNSESTQLRPRAFSDRAIIAVFPACFRCSPWPLNCIRVWTISTSPPSGLSSTGQKSPLKMFPTGT